MSRVPGVVQARAGRLGSWAWAGRLGSWAWAVAALESAALGSAAWGAPPPMVGGVPSAGGWPQAAALLWEGEARCSGVWLAEGWVLTAGHCAADPPDTVLLSTLDVNSPGTTHAVLEAHAHPDYWETLDLGLVRVQPAPALPALELALGCALVDLYDGAPALGLGFGHQTEDAQGEAGVLVEASMPIVDADCDDPTRGCRAPLGSELLAGGGGVDSCAGDSGGPLLLRGPGDTLRLVALTSRAAWPAERACGDGGVYTRLDAGRAWIEATTGLTLPEPACTPTEGNTPPSPSAGALRCAPGGSAEVRIFPNDPDREDRHAFSLVAVPAEGDTQLSAEGRLYYTASPGWEGQSAVTVQVHDGTDAATLDVPVLVQSADSGDDTVPLTPGCPVGGAAALGLVWGLPRRRRSGPLCPRAVSPRPPQSRSTGG